MIMNRDEATILRELGTDLVDDCKRRYADWHELTEAAQHELFDMLFEEIMQLVEVGMFERAGFKANGEAFVTRLRPFRLPDRGARQLPNLSAIIRVGSSSN
jgi:hypothetical protein